MPNITPTIQESGLEAAHTALATKANAILSEGSHSRNWAISLLGGTVLSLPWGMIDGNLNA
jgi:hypothetical protein